MDWEVDRMLDYRVTGMSNVLGFTRMVMRVGDIAQYVVPISDFGRAVVCFRFALPDDLSTDDLTKKFKEFTRTSRAFERLDRESMSRAEYEYHSLTHLGHDGYVGVYECGAHGTNEYMLVVQSYDMAAAEAFQETTARRVREFVDTDTPRPADRLAKLKRISKAHKTIETPHYQEAIVRSNINRRYLAAAFFTAFAIPFHQERVKCSAQEATIVLCSPTQLSTEYMCTFLAPVGKSYMRVYNSAYAFADVIDGAPWHMRWHEGFRTFYCADGSIKNDLREKYVAGAPMGSPYAHGARTYTKYAEVADRVNALVTWQSEINTMLVADPAMRHDTETAFQQLEHNFGLAVLRVNHWRTLGVAFVPPDTSKLSLRELVAYTDTPGIEIPFRTYDEILDTWLSLLMFKLHRARILAGVTPAIRERAPDDVALPSIRELFASESDDSTTCQMEKGILETLFENYDRVSDVMSMLSMNTATKRPGRHGMHKDILREAEAILDVPPAPPPGRDLAPSEDPIGGSGSEASTGMSDADVRMMYLTAATRERRKVARAKKAPPAAFTRTHRPDPAAFSNGYHDAPAGLATDEESDAYAELGVPSRDDDR